MILIGSLFFLSLKDFAVLGQFCAKAHYLVP